MPDFEFFVTEYRTRIQRAIEAKRLSREKCWTESIAVGGEAYVRRIAGAIRRERLRPRIEESNDGYWAVWEGSPDYQLLRIERTPSYALDRLERKNKPQNPD